MDTERNRDQYEFKSKYRSGSEIKSGGNIILWPRAKAGEGLRDLRKGPQRKGESKKKHQLILEKR